MDQLIFALPPFFTLKLCCASRFFISLSTGFIVVASNIISCAAPVKSLSDKLVTLAVKVIVSPSRKNRGAFGVTIRSFCVTSSFSVKPYFKSFVWANPNIFQRVSASGMVKLTSISPLASVCRSG